MASLTIWPGGLSVLVPPPFVFDATVREQHMHVNAVSSKPVGDASIVTDHVQPQPTAPVFEVVLTDHPAIPKDPLALGQTITGPKRHGVLYSRLLALDNGLPFDASCSLAVYPSMVFLSIGAPRNATSGNAIVCTVTLRQIEIATVDQVAVLAAAALAMSLGTQDMGDVPFDSAAPA